MQGIILLIISFISDDGEKYLFAVKSQDTAFSFTLMLWLPIFSHVNDVEKAFLDKKITIKINIKHLNLSPYKKKY